MADINRLSELLAEIEKQTAEMASLSEGVARIVAHEGLTGSPDKAIDFGLMAAPELSKRYDALLARFEAEALACLGERRQPAESPSEFFSRVCASDLMNLAGRNGVRFVR